jgi:hypothetical protein
MAGLIPIKFKLSPYSACAAISGPTGFSQVRPLNQVIALYQFFFGSRGKQARHKHISNIQGVNQVRHYSNSCECLIFPKATDDYKDYTLCCKISSVAIN